MPLKLGSASLQCCRVIAERTAGIAIPGMSALGQKQRLRCYSAGIKRAARISLRDCRNMGTIRRPTTTTLRAPRRAYEENRAVHQRVEDRGCSPWAVTVPPKGYCMATKERLAAMAASRCAVCSGAMALTLVKVDPTNDALEFRTYLCEECGHSQTYSVDAGDS
jgi:hypothetical protein